jgi:hypothetical protein
MNFDDTARFLGPSNKLWPELFAEKKRRPEKENLFPCLVCGSPMAWIDRTLRWECPRCRFFYKPLKPRTIPKKYLGAGRRIKRVCRICRRVEVTGKRQFCTQCAAKRKAALAREALCRKRSLNHRAMANSPIRAEALTNAEIANRYGDTTQTTKGLESGAL